ncbi:MAG: NMD3-related protein [Nanopusillaceae archaeon]
MKKICPACGRETDKLYEGLCLECYIKYKKEKEEEKERVVHVCRYCGRVRYKNKWYDNFQIKENDKIRYVVCDLCKRKIKKYNLIIQIRNLDLEIINKIKEFVNKNNDLIKKIEENGEKSYDIYLYVGKNKIKNYYKFLKKYGSIKITRKLFKYDKRSGRKKYIVTLLVRAL